MCVDILVDILVNTYEKTFLEISCYSTREYVEQIGSKMKTNQGPLLVYT